MHGPHYRYLNEGDTFVRRQQTRLGIIFGQSNAIGLCTAANVNNAGTDLTLEYPNVQLYNHNSLLQDPPSWHDETWSNLRPRTQNIDGVSFLAGTGGVELVAGRQLDQAPIGSLYLAKMAIDGSGLEDNWLSPTYPTTGTKLQQLLTDFVTARIADTGAQLAFFWWLQGEHDAGQSPDNTDYLANLKTLFNGLRSSFPGNWYIVLNRLCKRGANAMGTPVRSAEESFGNNFLRAGLVTADDLSLRDAAHYIDNDYTTLAQRFAQKTLDLINAATTTGPQFVASGTPVAALSSGSLSPAWPTDHQINDIGMLILSGIGNTAYAAPSGWTEVTGSPQHDNAVSTNARLQMFWRRAISTSEATPTVADVAGDDAKAAVIMTFRGCTTTGNPWNVSAGATAASSTSVSAPTVTTTVPNTLVVNAVAHHIDIATPQFSTWANASLTNLTDHVDYATTNGTGSGFGVVVGQKAGVGAVSATTATLAAASTQALITIALKP